MANILDIVLRAENPLTKAKEYTKTFGIQYQTTLKISEYV